MYIHVFLSFSWPPRAQPKGGALSQLATGCVTCHTSHSCVTHFRPILGNLVEVTLVTSPFMYIVSHVLRELPSLSLNLYNFITPISLVGLLVDLVAEKAA